MKEHGDFMGINNKQNESLKTILVIDDETEILELTQIYLERMGFKVLTCANTDELVSMVKNNVIDAAVSDYFMPKRTGIECAKILRQYKGENFPIIMITAYLNAKIDEKTAINQGLSAILEKPVNFQRLAQILNRELKRFKLLRPEDFESIELQSYMTPINADGKPTEDKKRVTVIELNPEGIFVEIPHGHAQEGHEYFFQIICHSGSEEINLKFRGKTTCIEQLHETFDMAIVVFKDIVASDFNKLTRAYEEKQNIMNNFLKQSRGY
jgi:CheY-like chemotaxis protein